MADNPFAARDDIPEFDPRQSYADMHRQLAEQRFQANRFAVPEANRPLPGRSGPPRAFVDSPAPRVADPFTPVYEALSPTQGGYGLGQSLGEVATAPTFWDKVQASVPLIAAAAVPGPGAKRLPHRIENPIRAYHGSPHDFDRFDLSKIGTGEGAQAYGHGLYFAEKEGVARSYRDNLIPAGDALAGVLAADGKPTGYHNVDAMLAKLYGGDWEAFKRGQSGISKQLDAAIADIDSRGGIAPYKPASGKMYEVALHATPDQFLDWDKPLSGQSEAVKQMFAGAYRPYAQERLTDITGVHNAWERDMKGGATPQHRDLMRKYGALAEGDIPEGLTVPSVMHPPGKAESALSEAGIPGIRYLDQGSRGSGQGTYNYSVWTPEIIELLRKYGIAAPVAGGMLSNDGVQSLLPKQKPEEPQVSEDNPFGP